VTTATMCFKQNWSRGQKCPFSRQNGTSICDSHINSYEYVCFYWDNIC